MELALRLVNLSPIEASVSIETKDEEGRDIVKEFVLVEATEGVVVGYRNLLMAATKFNENMKPTSIEKMADAEPYLVANCLFEVYKNAGEVRRRPVPESVIRLWPSVRIVKPIFELAQKISGLKEDRTVEAIDKQIAELQKERAKLLEDETAKKSSSSTASNSASSETSGSLSLKS